MTEDSRGDLPLGASPPASRVVTGTVVLLAGLGMFFAAIFSASLVDKGAGSANWIQLPIPRVLWANTAVLLASCLTLGVSRNRLAAGLQKSFSAWWAATGILGCLFLLGQGFAARQLLAEGISFTTSASSSFFDILMAAHAACLLFGIAAIAILGLRRRARTGEDSAVKAAALYWQSFAALWLIILFFVMRIM